MQITRDILIEVINDMRGEMPECIRSLVAMKLVNVLCKGTRDAASRKEWQNFVEEIEAFAVECGLEDDVPKAPVDIQTDLSKCIQKWSRMDSFRGSDGELKGMSPVMRSLVTSMTADLVECAGG